MVSSIMKWSFAILIIYFLTGCGVGSSLQEESHMKEAPYKKIAQASVKNNAAVNSPIDFSWVEKAYEGVLVGADYPLGTLTETLFENEGLPTEEGNYEGGNFYQYEKVTYFADPTTKQVTAIARSISHLRLTVEDIKRALGNPDIEEWSDLEQYWNMEYTIGDNRLVFEYMNEKEVHFVWLYKNENHTEEKDD